jgi:mono/diheme cytochrome c family protein
VFAAFRRTTVAVATGIVLLTIGARPAPARQDEKVIEKGKAVYKAQKCSTCHSIAGAGKKTSPLDGVGTKLSADEIRLWIVNPKEATAKAKSTKKPPMPDKYSKLPGADIDALVAYMQSLK